MSNPQALEEHIMKSRSILLLSSTNGLVDSPISEAHWEFDITVQGRQSPQMTVYGLHNRRNAPPVSIRPDRLPEDVLFERKRASLPKGIDTTLLVSMLATQIRFQYRHFLHVQQWLPAFLDATFQVAQVHWHRRTNMRSALRPGEWMVDTPSFRSNHLGIVLMYLLGL